MQSPRFRVREKEKRRESEREERRWEARRREERREEKRIRMRGCLHEWEGWKTGMRDGRRRERREGGSGERRRQDDRGEKGDEMWYFKILNSFLSIFLSCGWGAYSLWMLQKFPTVTVFALSNSSTQRTFIEKRAKELGVQDRLTVQVWLFYAFFEFVRAWLFISLMIMSSLSLTILFPVLCFDKLLFFPSLGVFELLVPIVSIDLFWCCLFTSLLFSMLFALSLFFWGELVLCVCSSLSLFDSFIYVNFPLSSFRLWMLVNFWLKSPTIWMILSTQLCLSKCWSTAKIIIAFLLV